MWVRAVVSLPYEHTDILLLLLLVSVTEWSRMTFQVDVVRRVFLSKRLYFLHKIRMPWYV
jgi:hypothetical protein